MFSALSFAPALKGETAKPLNAARDRGCYETFHRVMTPG